MAESSLPSERRGGQTIAGFALRAAAVVVGLSAVVYGYQVLLGEGDPGQFRYVFPIRYFLYGLTFLTATAFLRSRAWMMAAVLGPCAHHLWATSHPLALYAAALLPAMHWALGAEAAPTRGQRARFWGLLILGTVLGPKLIHHFGRLEHGSWLDLNQNLFAGLFLRYAYFYWERVRGFVPPGGFAEEAAYLLFVPQITGMLNLPPSEMAARWGFGWNAGLRRGFEGVAWAAVKIAALLYVQRHWLPQWGYGQGIEALRTASRAALWGCFLLTYLHWFMLISAKFDLMIALFRFFGVDADDNFRWPLLATSPVDLWRRWNIYNRKLLLKWVYFPLGGKHRHVYPNILATFLASALLLHTGYLGSPWRTVDLWQLRDWLIYFAAQGTLVCGTYWWTQRPFWTTLPTPLRLGLRGAGWAFTLVSSAWLHVLPLAAGSLLNQSAAPIAGFNERAGLMLRALGLPWGG